MGEHKRFGVVYMNSMQNLLSISQCLSGHPVLNEGTAYKVKYLNIVEYFLRKYSISEPYPVSSFENAKLRFLGSEAHTYSFNEEGIKKATKSVGGLRFKGFRVFTYRYALLFDCLFICAFNDEARGMRILSEFKEMVHHRYHAKLETFFHALYHNGNLPPKADFAAQFVSMWHENMRHYYARPKTILVSAAMSSGKSTVVNALVGKKVSRTMSEACTAKLHYIVSKAFEDGMTSEFDHELVLDADITTLMEDNENNQSDVITVGTAFRFADGISHKVQLIDTPGVGSFWNKEHQDIAEKALSFCDYDTIVCILNGESLGTDFTNNHLCFLRDNHKDKPIIFLVNKTDGFNKSQDSIQASVAGAAADLEKIGFTEFSVYPISARAGFLAKQAIYGECLSDDDQEDLGSFVRKYRQDFFDCSKFYPQPDPIFLEQSMSSLSEQQQKYMNVIIKSGLLGFESILYRQ